MNKQVFVVGAITLIVSSAGAQVVPDRATLQSILPGGTLEDFEALPVSFGGQLRGGGTLTSASTFSGYGPGLVQAGASYSATRLFWNGDQYYGLNTRTLGDSAVGGPITIAYSVFVTAMGIDLQMYAGYGMNGTIRVYDTSNNLLHTQTVTTGDTFFGYQYAGGIGSVSVSAASGYSDYIMIDNHLYGVPTPGAAGLLGVAGAGVARRRRR